MEARRIAVVLMALSILSMGALLSTDEIHACVFGNMNNWYRPLALYKIDTASGLCLQIQTEIEKVQSDVTAVEDKDKRKKFQDELDEIIELWNKAQNNLASAETHFNGNYITANTLASDSEEDLAECLRRLMKLSEDISEDP